MKVTLISHTPDALTLLLKTKNTRLKFDSDPATWPEAERQQHLAYMKDTIKSSWEMVDYVFQIEDVTRAFTHQLVRTRAGSYAQESQRTVDVSDHGWLTPEFDDDGVSEKMYNRAMAAGVAAYADLLRNNVHPQDARGVLPTNIHTSIVAKFSLRTLHDMALVRLCTRTQGEYQRVFRAMKAAVVEVHPWAEPFIRVACAQNGVCVFPRYDKCPIQPLTYNAEPGHAARLQAIAEAAAATTHAAEPVATAGRTM
jgi:flavin-dependent thymidylate synthase